MIDMSGQECKEREETQMHDLVIGVLFIAMIVAPAIVAARNSEAK